MMQRTAEVSRHSGRAALPLLLPFGLSVDEHFEAALRKGDNPIPTERLPLLDRDLWFAAEKTARRGGSCEAFVRRACAC